ncbi:hypothetical protein BDZ89DRAFT_1072234 [Hymenopellis radicata]|nr:hypothetical protein BDZ89DRAFT_1072234 [Hymenopellis radicata]
MKLPRLSYLGVVSSPCATSRDSVSQEKDDFKARFKEWSDEQSLWCAGLNGKGETSLLRVPHWATSSKDRYGEFDWLAFGYVKGVFASDLSSIERQRTEEVEADCSCLLTREKLVMRFRNRNWILRSRQKFKT